MKRRYEAISILTSEDGKTIGAKLQAYDTNGWICRFSTKQLRENKDKIEIVNAIIDDRGYIRSRSGELRKEKISTNKSNVYYIMCKDIKVCIFNRNTGEASIIRDDLLPLDIYLEDGELADRFNNKVVFDWWCAQRILSLDRKYAKEILNSCNLKQARTDKDKADIALKYKCLSLKDFYWVQEIHKTYKWRDVCLFHNSLSNSVMDIALMGRSLTLANKKLIDSDLSTDGVFPKAWYRKDGKFYLYKGDLRESVKKEVMASKILRELQFDVLEYKYGKYDCTDVSVCECFTNENVGYITAGNLNQNYDLSKNYKQYDMMLLCDYLVGNSDRHQDNWGYLFNDKREIIGFAPIFDFNHCFESSERSLSLPEAMFSRRITMFDAAKEIVNKYKIVLKPLHEYNEYYKFVNDRIKLLGL